MAETIVVMAPNWLGDAVMALPAIGAVRRHHHASRLVVAARRSVAGLFGMTPGVDEVVTLEAGGGWRGASAWLADAEALARVGAAVAIVLPNSYHSAWTVRRAGIRERWGYAVQWRSQLLTRAIQTPRRPVRQADYFTGLTRSLGMPATGEPPRLLVPDHVRARAAEVLARRGIDGSAMLIGMAPGAVHGHAKQWPPERYASVACLLHQRRGLVSVLVGTAGDRAASRLVNAGAAVLDLVGDTDLELAVGLMTRFLAFVTNDSGAMHLAAATGLPVTALFGPTNERATSPLPSASPSAPPHAILTGDAWCRPCMLRECPFDHRCMTSIAPERVAAEIGRQVDRQIARADA